MRIFLHFVATGFYTGYLPRAPGTWATILIGIPVCVALKCLGEIGFLVALAAIFGVSVLSSGFVERELAEKDPPFVVIDEVVGYLSAMLFVPISVTHIVCACVFFRLFDIVKPCPIRMVEKRLPGGWGITLDDVVAGLYANICVHLIGYLL